MSIKHLAWAPVVVFVVSVALFVNYGRTGIRLAENNHGLGRTALQLIETNDRLKRCVSGIGELVRRVQDMERLMMPDEIRRGYAARTRCLEPTIDEMAALKATLGDHGGERETGRLLAEFRVATAAWLLEAERILGLVPARSIMTSHSFERSSVDIDRRLSSLAEEVRRVPATIARQNAAQVTSLQRVLFLSLLLFSAIMACAILLARRLAAAVDRIVAAMRELCRGNTHVEIPREAGQGELARLADGVSVFRDALIDVMQGEERYAHLANHDPLTDACNRRRLMEAGERLIRERGDGSVVMIKMDLDRFKQINDACGHAAGDALLVDTVGVMWATLREGDLLARLGGDEFVAVLVGADSRDVWTDVVERLVTGLREPMRFSGRLIERSVSVGVSVCPEDGESVDELLMNADIALYAAKARGRDGFVRVNGEMIAENRARIALSREIEEAVARGEFAAHFQPKVDPTTDEVVGFEALARWNHAERGVLGPYHFLEAAESSELVVRIGEQVLLETVRAVKTLQAAGFESTISVNASARELALPDYAERFVATLRTHEVDLGAVSVELLETVELEDANECARVNLERLNRHGVSTWIDDFGVGFSTVGVLQHDFVHGVKIDRRFVCDERSSVRDRTLLDTLVRMAHGMGKRCVLEGVENEAELRVARAIGCDVVQGYHYARPMPLEELVPWWREHACGAEGDGRKAA